MTAVDPLRPHVVINKKGLSGCKTYPRVDWIKEKVSCKRSYKIKSQREGQIRRQREGQSRRQREGQTRRQSDEKTRKTRW